MSSHPFIQRGNRELIRELSTDLLKTQYKFHRLTGRIIMPEVYDKLEKFIEVQQQMIYQNRFQFPSVKEMNKEMLKQVNTFLYHLYKQYKLKYNQEQSITEIYSRTNETTQDYKDERKNELEKVMQLNRADMESYTTKPKEMKFEEAEVRPMDPNEMQRILQTRQQEYQQQPPVVNTNETKTNKKVSFGENNETSYDKDLPSVSVSHQTRQEQITSSTQQEKPSLQTMLSRLKAPPQQTTIQHHPNILKRIALYLATSSMRHQFLRIRVEQATQSNKQHAVNLVNTTTSDLPISLNNYQQPFEEYLLQRAEQLWEWWVFIEDIIRNTNNKQDAQRWVQYIQLDSPLDFENEYPYLQGWLDASFSIPT